MATTPWIGDRYDAGGLLLMGESFYSYPEDGELNVPSGERICIDQVGWVLDDFEACVSGPQRTPFIVKLSRALTGQYAPGKSALRNAWSKVLFTDFVDDSVGEKGTKPTEQQWVAGQTAFRPFLEEHKPGRALIFGRTTTWVWLPPSDKKNLGPYTEAMRRASRGHGGSPEIPSRRSDRCVVAAPPCCSRPGVVDARQQSIDAPYGAQSQEPLATRAIAHRSDEAVAVLGQGEPAAILALCLL